MRYLLILLCLISLPAFAQEKFDYGAFSKIPVQHEGRLKPMDSFARALLKNFSGASHVNGLDADEWMAQSLFDPATAMEQPVFHLPRPDVAGLPKQKGLYAYTQLAPALVKKTPVIESLLKTDMQGWTPEQAELVRMYEISAIYAQLLRSLSSFLPLSLPVPESLQKEWGLKDGKPLTLESLRKFQRRLMERVKDLAIRKGDNPSSYSEEEREIAAFAYQVNMLETAGEGNIMLRIVPPAWGAEEWLSPAALAQFGQGSPQTAAYLQSWKSMAGAYHDGDGAAWNKASKEALRRALEGQEGIEGRLRVETIYNVIAPLQLALVFYILSFSAMAAFSFRKMNALKSASVSFLIGGAVLHSAAIAARIYILDRPPVGTLYESIIFVAAVCVIGALIVESRHRSEQFVYIGSAAGAALLLVASGFAEDDTMKMLIAVLNTNLWLTVHVLCISIGYAWCVVAATSAHVVLLLRALNKTAMTLEKSLPALSLTALLFTATGTILGGIWADQSWGRFWGWDPKENGALLIALWLIWILHGRIGAHLKPLSFTAGVAFLNVIVALSWFGVNLLGAGLHSYGFIEGIALSLALFCTAEIVLIGGAAVLIRRRDA